MTLEHHHAVAAFGKAQRRARTVSLDLRNGGSGKACHLAGMRRDHKARLFSDGEIPGHSVQPIGIQHKRCAGALQRQCARQAGGIRRVAHAAPQNGGAAAASLVQKRLGFGCGNAPLPTFRERQKHRFRQTGGCGGDHRLNGSQRNNAGPDSQPTQRAQLRRAAKAPTARRHQQLAVMPLVAFSRARRHKRKNRFLLQLHFHSLLWHNYLLL